jgi:hypothetical protein
MIERCLTEKCLVARFSMIYSILFSVIHLSAMAFFRIRKKAEHRENQKPKFSSNLINDLFVGIRISNERTRQKFVAWQGVRGVAHL